MDKKFYVKVDEKVTVWNRHTLQVKNVATVQEAIDKVIHLYEKNQDMYDDPDVFPTDVEALWDTEEGLTPQENEGWATIEILDQQYDPIWNNVNHRLSIDSVKPN